MEQPLKRTRVETVLTDKLSYSPDIATFDDTPRSSPDVNTESDQMSDVGRKVVVGVCAMNKKTLAPPMQSILSRMNQHMNIKIVVFSDDTILNKPVTEWPVCDCLIAFFSKGFPLQKAIEYANMYKPMLFNDLEIQYHLQDREQVHNILVRNGIRVPRFAVLKRPDDGFETTEPTKNGSDELKETDDTIEVNGQVFHKPFVEKPISAEDHNVYVYFRSDYGGGCQKLFRKVGNRSSSYTTESSVRRDGSYIYEEFLATDGVDVKVYTVGPDYAHAEARKCPSLDGIVVRDDEGIEKRYPVILTSEEKLIARKVSLAFKQTVCGFDLLRANGKSYVCDVNGFSFVKKSEKYYDDCAQILLEMIIRRFDPEYIPHTPPSVEYIAQDVPVPIPKSANNTELRCVIGIIRHGDRTPKQKMKMLVNHRKFYELFRECVGYETGSVKIKEPRQLQKLLNITRSLLEGPEEVFEEVHKLQQLKTVLEMYGGHFSGINRKVQFKLVNRRSIGDEDRPMRVLLLILKWGGELTPVGKKQAEELGRAFRCMYPGGEGEYASLPGSGFLRLHSTFRHDLKVYASDEGRVQMTAAAFTKGLLDLEGSLASVRTHLVKRDRHATDLLDTSNGAEEEMRRVKDHLHEIMRSSDDFTEESIHELAPTRTESLLTAMRYIKNPVQACEHLYQQIRTLTDEIRERVSDDPHLELYHDETPQMMLQRWAKLEKDFKLGDGTFDISKIPDIYDCIKYDLLHNGNLGLQNTFALYETAMYFADIIIPQEYGITKDEKLSIAKTICNPLLRKIQSDLRHVVFDESSDINHRLDPELSKHIVITPSRHVRSRLYFTSESHVHGMINILQFGGLFGEDDEFRGDGWMRLSSTPELNFLSQIVFLMFEDKSKPYDSPDRYYIDLHIGSGVKTRKSSLELESAMMFTDGESLKFSPSFVKRLPFERMPDTTSMQPKNLQKTTSFPTVYDEEDTDSVVSPPKADFEHHHNSVAVPSTQPSKAYSEHRRNSIPVPSQQPPPKAYFERHRNSASIPLPKPQQAYFARHRTSLTDNIVLRAPSGRKQSYGYTEESVQTLGERGLVLAAQLSSTVEPLTHMDTQPVHKVMDFLEQLIRDTTSKPE